ncbi:MAG TPA: hypothetical protein C5S37_09345 [Methanophagales archaeon]|nr:hypothetical protein [Methanophagales archaeon]
MVAQNAVTVETRQVNASEILEKIEKGVLVDEENCTIIGDLDLSKINLSTIKVDGRELRRVNNSISIKNSIIKGNVNFRGESKDKRVYFRGPVNFDGTNFAEEANFKYSIFSDSARFDNAIFDGIAKFGDAQFTHTTFWNATFNSRSNFASSIFYDRGQFTFANFSHFSRFDYAHFNNGADFNFVHFNGVVHFYGTCFYNDAQFTGTVFNNKTWFHSTVFNGFTSFNCDFMNHTYFQNATFNGIVIFNKDFHAVANFADVKFNDRVEFKDYFKFNENALFCDATFTGLADFENARFMKDADFSNAEFNDEAKFKKVTFNGNASFMDAIFTKAYFDFAKFNKSANFINTNFNDKAKFKGVTFNGYASFTDATFTKAYFEGATFTKIDFRYVDFEIIEINWSQLKGKLIYSGRLYQALIKNFKALEQFEDADDAYYEYRKIKQSQKEWGDYTKYTDAFSKCICGYGVKPHRAPLFGILIILLFSLGYYQTGAIKQTCSKVFPKPKNRFWKLVDEIMKQFLKNHKRYKNALYFSASTFLALSHGDWYPTAKFLKIGKVEICRFRTTAIIETFLGWIILVLFVISLTMTWIR